MELTNEFVIERNIEETWKILNDLEFIAPCMPGAQLQEIEGDEYRGVVKIKVGPIQAQYKGKASFIEQDAANKVARLKAEGRDVRQGNANAMVTAKMEELGAEQTRVEIHTDLGLSGKIAQFGRGAVEDVSKKILTQFVDNLRDKLAAEGSEPEAAAAPAASVASATDVPKSGPPPSPASTVTSNGGASTDDSDGNVRKIQSPEPEPVDLLAVSGESMVKRLVPAAGGAALILVIIYWLLGRG